MFRRLNAFLLFVVLGMGTIIAVPAGTPSRRAAAYIDRSWHEHPVPGWCIAIAQQGRIVFSKPVGVADLDNNVPTRMDTVYNMGSVSKVNTTVAVMHLYKQERFAPFLPIKKRTVTTFSNRHCALSVCRKLTPKSSKNV